MSDHRASAGHLLVHRQLPRRRPLRLQPASAVRVAVAKAKSRSSLKLSAASVVYGNEKALKLTGTAAPQFTGTPGGVVTITAGQATLCTVTLSGGTGSCFPSSATVLNTGRATLTASYTGSADFLPSSAARPSR